MPEDSSWNDFLRGELTRPEGPTVQAKVKVYTLHRNGVDDEGVAQGVCLHCCGDNLNHRGSSSIGGLGSRTHREGSSTNKKEIRVSR